MKKYLLLLILLIPFTVQAQWLGNYAAGDTIALSWTCVDSTVQLSPVAAESVILLRFRLVGGAASPVLVDSTMKTGTGLTDNDVDRGTGHYVFRMLAGTGSTQGVYFCEIRGWNFNEGTFNRRVYGLFKTYSWSVSGSYNETRIVSGETTTTVLGNVNGSVNSVTTGVTVTTNNDKTGYALTSAEHGIGADSTWRKRYNTTTYVDTMFGNQDRKMRDTTNAIYARTDVATSTRSSFNSSTDSVTADKSNLTGAVIQAVDTARYVKDIRNDDTVIVNPLYTTIASLTSADKGIIADSIWKKRFASALTDSMYGNFIRVKLRDTLYSRSTFNATTDSVTIDLTNAHIDSLKDWLKYISTWNSDNYILNPSFELDGTITNGDVSFWTTAGGGTDRGTSASNFVSGKYSGYIQDNNDADSVMLISRSFPARNNQIITFGGYAVTDAELGNKTIRLYRSGNTISSTISLVDNTAQMHIAQVFVGTSDSFRIKLTVAGSAAPVATVYFDNIFVYITDDTLNQTITAAGGADNTDTTRMRQAGFMRIYTVNGGSDTGYVKNPSAGMTGSSIDTLVVRDSCNSVNLASVFVEVRNKSGQLLGVFNTPTNGRIILQGNANDTVIVNERAPSYVFTIPDTVIINGGDIDTVFGCLFNPTAPSISNMVTLHQNIMDIGGNKEIGAVATIELQGGEWWRIVGADTTLITTKKFTVATDTAGYWEQPVWWSSTLYSYNFTTNTYVASNPKYLISVVSNDGTALTPRVIIITANNVTTQKVKR